MKKLWIIVILLMFSCENESMDNEITYEKLVEDAWNAFEQKDYTKAINTFTEAYEKDREAVDAIVGLGWALMLNQEADKALSKLKLVADENSNVRAGLAFLNHLKGDYTESNTNVDNLLTSEPSWSFNRGLKLDVTDLYVLQGQNYYLLGNFEESLNHIKKVDANFDADISTYEGRSKLASKIEKLNSSALPSVF